MAHPDSEYYPPRAKGPHRLQVLFYSFRRLQYSLGYRNRLKIPQAPRMLLERRTYLIALLPGYGFAARGHLLAAGIACALWCVFGLEMLVYLGRTGATYAIAGMVAVHATGVIHAVHEKVFGGTRWSCMKARLLVVVLIGPCLYFPGFQLLKRVVLPLQIGGEPIIVNVLAGVPSLERGDTVAYRFDERRGNIGGAILRGGFGVDRVLALPGDRVVFRENFVEVNGQRMEAPEAGMAMPQRGELLIPEDHWYIWPSFIHMGNSERGALELLMEAAVVPEANIIGKPFRRWFWREQYEPVQ